MDSAGSTIGRGSPPPNIRVFFLIKKLVSHEFERIFELPTPTHIRSFWLARDGRKLEKMMNRAFFYGCLSFVCVLVLSYASCGPDVNTTEKGQETVIQDQGDASNNTEVQQELTRDAPVGQDKKLEPSNPPDTSEPTEQKRENTVIEDPPRDTPASSLTVEKICQKLATARCQPLFKCCQGVTLPFADLADCKSKLIPQCIAGASKEKLALAAGHVVVSENHMNACLAAFNKAGQQCKNENAEALQQTCVSTYQDKAGLGQNCASKISNIVCADGKGSCRFFAGSKKCLAWAKEGEECTVSVCQTGLKCMIDAPKGETKPSCRKPGEKDAYCNKDSHCQPALRCSNKQKCETALVEGDRCQRAGQCATAFACDLDKQKCVKRVAQGQPCMAHPQCQQGLRCLGLALKGSCQKRGQVGDACESTPQCAEGNTCDRTTKKCKKLAKQGETCRSGSDCGAGLGCDTKTSQCVTLPTEGKACLFGVKECAAGLSCYTQKKGQGVCQRPTQEGTPCTKDTNCETGLGCSSDRCTKLPTVGQKCLNGRLCLNSYCDSTITCKNYVPSGGSCRVGNECGPQGACIQKGPKTLVCAPIPKAGESCLTTCASGLFCKRTLQPGTCRSEICSL